MVGWHRFHNVARGWVWWWSLLEPAEECLCVLFVVVSMVIG
jgi:hypothetical protein